MVCQWSCINSSARNHPVQCHYSTCYQNFPRPCHWWNHRTLDRISYQRASWKIPHYHRLERRSPMSLRNAWPSQYYHCTDSGPLCCLGALRPLSLYILPMSLCSSKVQVRVEGLFWHTLGPSGGHTRPIRQWHIQPVIRLATSHSTILSPHGPDRVGEHCESRQFWAFISMLNAHHTQIYLPVFYS